MVVMPPEGCEEPSYLLALVARKSIFLMDLDRVVSWAPLDQEVVVHHLLEAYSDDQTLYAVANLPGGH